VQLYSHLADGHITLQVASKFVKK